MQIISLALPENPSISIRIPTFKAKAEQDEEARTLGRGI
jgi:hypothetical protein